MITAETLIIMIIIAIIKLVALIILHRYLFLLVNRWGGEEYDVGWTQIEGHCLIKSIFQIINPFQKRPTNDEKCDAIEDGSHVCHYPHDSSHLRRINANKNNKWTSRRQSWILSFFPWSHLEDHLKGLREDWRHTWSKSQDWSEYKLSQTGIWLDLTLTCLSINLYIQPSSIHPSIHHCSQEGLKGTNGLYPLWGFRGARKAWEYWIIL